MSQENVEIVKRGITAFNQRDVETLDEITTDDYEWFPAFAGIVEGGSYRGRAGIETYFLAATDTWEEVPRRRRRVSRSRPTRAHARTC
jgi:ketosteroid isomerase-like protein